MSDRSELEEIITDALLGEHGERRGWLTCATDAMAVADDILRSDWLREQQTTEPTDAQVMEAFGDAG